MLIRLAFNPSKSRTSFNFGKHGTFKDLDPITLPFALSLKDIESRLDGVERWIIGTC